MIAALACTICSSAPPHSGPKQPQLSSVQKSSVIEISISARTDSRICCGFAACDLATE